MISVLLFILIVPRLAADELEQKPDEHDQVLVIVPLGEVDPKLVDFLAKSLKGRFAFQVKTTKAYKLPKSAWYKPRKRWRAEKLLDFLDSLELKDVWRVCGITEQPISTTKGARYDWGIAGLGTMSGKTSVLTSYLFRRFKKRAPKKYYRYLENLVIHEVGHTLGLEHCPLDRCIMADAKGNAIKAARKSTNQFCPHCHQQIYYHLKDKKIEGKWSAEELKIIDFLP
jgi:archaemetzincin